jgi:hypothetical protein
MRDVGHTLEDIGQALGITRERVRQLLVGGQNVRGVSSGRASSVDPSGRSSSAFGIPSRFSHAASFSGNGLTHYPPRLGPRGLAPSEETA